MQAQTHTQNTHSKVYIFKCGNKSMHFKFLVNNTANTISHLVLLLRIPTKNTHTYIYVFFYKNTLLYSATETNTKHTYTINRKYIF